MTCYHLLTAYQRADKKVVFNIEHAGGDFTPLLLPCGKCWGCRLERSRQWAIRCMHENKMHKQSSFITLTYDNENCPSDMSLKPDHLTLFLKRYREWLRRRDGGEIRYYACGEYGDENKRPHYHAIIFGHNFDDRKFYKTGTGGLRLWTSATLEDIWGYGFCPIGEVTFESAAYVARYVMKKITGDAKEKHYEYVDPDGEIHQREPEFNRMSLKPGIGAGWFDKYSSDVYPSDSVIVRGREARPPKYYDVLYERKDPLSFDAVKIKRIYEASLHSSDNEPERLKVRETVAQAKMRNHKRSV